jgi:hypothetical protein
VVTSIQIEVEYIRYDLEIGPALPHIKSFSKGLSQGLPNPRRAHNCSGHEAPHTQLQSFSSGQGGPRALLKGR